MYNIFKMKPEWVYGTCNNSPARKHRKKGNVQMKLWKAGEQGHKDTNKLNDCEWNLEWATHQENVIHAIKNNCRKSFKLSDETIAKIASKSKKVVIVTNTSTNKTFTVNSINQCASLLEVTQSAISKALRRNSLISNKYKVSYASTL